MSKSTALTFQYGQCCGFSQSIESVHVAEGHPSIEQLPHAAIPSVVIPASPAFASNQPDCLPCEASAPRALPSPQEPLTMDILMQLFLRGRQNVPQGGRRE